MTPEVVEFVRNHGTTTLDQLLALDFVKLHKPIEIHNTEGTLTKTKALTRGGMYEGRYLHFCYVEVKEDVYRKHLCDPLERAA